MISAWRALALSFSSSVILAFSRSSLCFWLAMTLAACSLSRRCWPWASAIACSSCTLGSARSLNEPVSFAVRYFHHFLASLNMGLELTAAVAGRRPGSRGPQRRSARAPGARRARRRRRRSPTTAADDHAHPRPGAGGVADAVGDEPRQLAGDRRGDDDPPQAGEHGAQREAGHLVRQHLQRPQRRTTT